MMESGPHSKGNLYLVPNTLGKTGENKTIPVYTTQIIRRLRVLVVENIQTTRSYLQWIGDTVPEYEIRYFVLNKDTTAGEIVEFLKPAHEGMDIGLISEAGCPGVADPGARLVWEAHRQHIRVIPLTGPNSMLLALMASGFNGQSFAFWGYLPIGENNRKDAILRLERDSSMMNVTHIVMEAPHRNRELLTAFMNTCRDDSRLCTATDLTLPTETVISRSIGEWKKNPPPDLQKRPTVFLLYAGEINHPTKSRTKKSFKK